MINRRRFGSALAASLLIAPSTVARSAAKKHRIGFLLGASRESVASLFQSLQEGLRDLGYVDGDNIVFVQRYGDGRMDRLPDLAAELATSVNRCRPELAGSRNGANDPEPT
jgi:ABC-type uncharacterized transport system substrate-binding protein